MDDIPELKNFNASVMPNVEQAKNLFKEKCNKNGGPDAFENAQKAQAEMTECVRSLVNITELQVEMEKYKPTGDLDVVFKNYCDRRSHLRSCVYNFTNTVEHCLDEKEKKNKKIVMNITDSMLEFICFKQGDRIARNVSIIPYNIIKFYQISKDFPIQNGKFASVLKFPVIFTMLILITRIVLSL